MAGYREHITVSSLLGVGYGTGAALAFGFTPVQGALAACLTGVAGMLPDLDSDTGRPVRELFGVVAAVVPLLLVAHILHWTGLPGDTETVMLIIVVLYGGIRFGLAALVSKLSVHRGMFHSIPALLIAAETTYLGYPSPWPAVKLMVAGGVALGFASHLLLDELYSVQVNGVRVRLKKSSGTAFKMVGEALLPNVFTYALLATLSYAMLSDAGVLPPPPDEQFAVPLPQADATLGAPVTR